MAREASRILRANFTSAHVGRFHASFRNEAPVTVAPGASGEATARLFAGAKIVSLIDQYREQYGIVRFDLTIDWGWFWFLTKPLFWLLDKLFGLIGNFGVAILALTVLVKLAFFPLANKSYESMTKMKALQPEMEKLRARFSEDKTPLKTHVAWVLRPRGFAKGTAAGLYAEFSLTETWIGGGLYHPEPSIRHAVREHIAAHHRRLRRIVEAPAFRKTVGPIDDGEAMTRVPRGFDPEHPAADFLKLKHWVVARTMPGAFVTEPDFYPTLLAIFRTAAPFIRFLNEPIAALGPAALPKRPKPRGVEPGSR